MEVFNIKNEFLKKLLLACSAVALLGLGSCGGEDAESVEISFCGDSILQAEEECDDGNTNNEDGCSSVCMIEALADETPPVCGDGKLQEGEECDDGNLFANDGCSGTCQEESCGDGVIQLNETCDDGSDNGQVGSCNETCDGQTEYCGDGIKQIGEACDDGNDVNDDECSNSCALPGCGDGILQEGEECDDGNLSNNDNCPNTCQLATCGDGFINLEVEECDDQDNENNNSCANDCKINYCMQAAIDKSPSSYFGNSVAVQGNILAVGAYQDDANGVSESGSVYICEKDLDAQKWIQTKKLSGVNTKEKDYFGNQVAISGNTLVVGVPRDDSKGIDSGSAYVYQKQGKDWKYVNKLYAADNDTPGDRFGQSVAIDGDIIVVGANYDDQDVHSGGSAYIFKKSGSNWVKVQRIVSSEQAGHQFGYSVAVDGSQVIAGAPSNNGGQGAVFVFKKSLNNWQEVQKIVASDGDPSDGFGNSVSMDGNKIAVGARSDKDNGNLSGSAYLFEKSGDNWFQKKKFLAPDGVALDHFGHSVAVSGDTVVVGSPYDDDSLNLWNDRGSVYLFKKSGNSWIPKKLLASNGFAVDRFGYSVAIDQTTIVIGAVTADYDSNDAGFAYILEELNLDNWQEVQ